MALLAVSGGSSLEYAVELSVPIPLLGAKIEASAAPAITRVLEAERAAILELLTGAD
jgi:hypothetical protein